MKVYTKNPWRAVSDPDGPTTILDAGGRMVAVVEPRLAPLIRDAPTMLGMLRTLHDRLATTEFTKPDSRHAIVLTWAEVMALEKILDDHGGPLR